MAELKKLGKKIILTFYLKPSILDGERPPVGEKASLAGSGVSYLKKKKKAYLTKRMNKWVKQTH